MDDTSGVILRHKGQVGPGVLLVSPPNMGLMDLIPSGHFASMHFGHFQDMAQSAGWTGQFGLEESLAAKVDHAIVWMPKARRELDLLVAWSQSQLSPGGRLWLVGAKRGGIESGGKALKKKLGTGTKLDSARHCQLWEYRIARPEPGFSIDDWLTEHEVAAPLPTGAVPLRIADMPGVFSEGRLDDGTELLLRSIGTDLRSPVLDFACGAGVIGAALAKHSADCDVTMLDVQWQAVMSSRKTISINGLSALVVPGNGLAGVEGRFASIITNPPFHSGLKTDLSIVRNFIAQVKAHLVVGGTLWLVANAFLPYRELLEERFPGVRIVGENSRFRVYRAQAR